MCKISPVATQFLTIACCNLLTLSFGMSNGWTTINLLELENENSTFATGPLTKQQTSWVIGLMNVGGIAGNWLVLPLSGFLGLKRTIHVLGIPIVLGSILTIYAQNVYYLYVSKLITGLVGGGLVVLISSLINDISNDDMRGALNCIYDPINMTGTIIAYFLGNILSCTDQIKIQLIPPALFFIALLFVKESPEYWKKRNKLKKAKKSLRFYKGSVAVLDKSETLEFISAAESGRVIEKSCDNDNADHSALTFSDFCTPHARRAIAISMPSLFLSLFTGVLSIPNFTTAIFNESGSSLSEKDSAILVAIITLAANLVTLNIIERFNRRTLYILSSICTMLSYLLFAVYGFFLKGQPGLEWMNWMPLFCFCSIVFTSWFGVVPIPYLLNIELAPKKILQTCIAMNISTNYTVTFVYNIIFYRFVDAFGLYTCMVVLSLFSLLTALFAVFAVPETRGKSFEEIRNLILATTESVVIQRDEL